MMLKHAVIKARDGATDTGKLVESTNALPPEHFFGTYCSAEVIEQAKHKINDLLGKQVDIVAKYAKQLKSKQQHYLDACFSLIEDSSANDYKQSSIKWSPSSKRREMLLPDMRYLIIEEPNCEPEVSSVRSVSGFVSFMITYEDGHEVIYIYEIHLRPSFRGQGVGEVLLDLVEAIGRMVEVEKCMLTVFRANARAVKWYNRMGYAIDDFSPGPRVMRNGAIKEPSYLILSKAFG